MPRGLLYEVDLQQFSLLRVCPEAFWPDQRRGNEIGRLAQ